MNINESKAILPNTVQTPIKDSSPHHQSLGDVGQKGPERLKGNDNKNNEKSYQRIPPTTPLFKLLPKSFVGLNQLIKLPNLDR